MVETTRRKKSLKGKANNSPFPSASKSRALPRKGGDCKITVKFSGERLFGRKTSTVSKIAFFPLRHVSKAGEGKSLLRNVRLGEGNRKVEAPSFISPKNTPPPPPRPPRKDDTVRANDQNPEQKAKVQHLS